LKPSPRFLVHETLDFDSPPRIPRQTWILPWAEDRFPEAVSGIRRRFPDDIVTAPAIYTKPLKTEGDRYGQGIYVDEWGCVFSNPQPGIIGIVRKPLIGDWEDLKSFQPPDAILSLDRTAVDDFCEGTDRFVLGGTTQRPFERFQFIRTMEQAMLDLVDQPPELFELLDRIHQHYCKEVEVWAATKVDGISLMDDWGTQTGLIASPEIFKKIFLPMYNDYVEIARRYGKRIFMHSDGRINDIIPDLIEAGIEALNSQIFCMGLEVLGERFKGKITFWGEIDRQNLLPYGSRADVERAVRSIYRELYAEGGVIAQCEFGLEAKPENVAAVFETWEALSRQKL